MNAPDNKYQDLMDLVLATIHKNRQGVNSLTLNVMKTSVRQAMRKFYSENRNPFSVDYDGKISALDLVISVLKDHEKSLDGIVNQLNQTTSGFDKLTRSSALKQRVRVGAVHRVTLKEFPTGLWLMKELLIRKDGSVGGVTLWVE